MAIDVATVHLDDFSKGTGATRDAFVSTLGQSLVETGFVKVDGHQVTGRDIEAAYGAARDFFALPNDAKDAYVRPKGAGGYTPFGTEHAKDSEAIDLKEFWHVHQDVPPEHPLFAAYGPNVFPAEVPHFQPAMMRLYRDLEVAAQTLLEAIAVYLGLPERDLADMVVDGRSVLRVIHYPPLAQAAPPGAVRAAAHEDINLITLLPAATESGLELLDRNGAWYPVDGLEGEIVVDAGDMLSRHANLKIPSTTHRVVNPDVDDVARYSMPFFCHPRPEVVLDAPPALVDGEEKLFEPITADAFLDQRLAEIGLT
ncbi:isopenicillin N synthase family dioxygenase [Iamia sp.]|uniref:isopenicillin N synthase family dioxygenase n=1 Tax=Iamia sp. TaxID=2722710 RepID=UPI002C99D8DE|nr:2-oxoglutarate and iron-dependent oxygenase domain-containing protein [Iamia sp.]HXH56006.1 2-oxoglutarate and iron-dependent oxygenase domain-containing protein [Iamia sp.]